ncbi:MAG TPA: hypothetical protein VHV10_06685 [Ktedonobacteraceae bacterium]|jgi:hypothetical protein|nr:hypothetical protein [Ktedonobacteraceae bacterium]
MSAGSHGRAKAGPYSIIQPAEAGTGRSRSPAYKLPDEKVKHHNWVPTIRAIPMKGTGELQIGGLIA